MFHQKCDKMRMLRLKSWTGSVNLYLHRKQKFYLEDDDPSIQAWYWWLFSSAIKGFLYFWIYSMTSTSILTNPYQAQTVWHNTSIPANCDTSVKCKLWSFHSKPRLTWIHSVTVVNIQINFQIVESISSLETNFEL